MPNTDYLIIGSSHAALSALHTLRMHDAEGAVTMVTRDATLPYSPTVLPYVVSGRSSPERVFLRDDAYFREQNVDYLRGDAVETVDAAHSVVRLADGREIAYGKLLVASGARPVIPAIPGLDRARFHVLRTLDDALALRDAASGAQRAVVLGAGLIGMHAAENLATGRRGRHDHRACSQHVLPGYFDADAAAMIEKAFAARGVRLVTGARVVRVEPGTPGCKVVLDNGDALDCDLLVVGVGVAPVTDFLAGSGVDTDRGVLVDDRMRSSVAKHLGRRRRRAGARLLRRCEDPQRNPARRRRAGPHRGHGDGRRPGTEALSGRRPAQHLHVLRPARGVGGRARRRRCRRRGREIGRYGARPLPQDRARGQPSARHLRHQHGLRPRRDVGVDPASHRPRPGCASASCGHRRKPPAR